MQNVHVVFFLFYAEEVTEPQLPAPLPLQTLFIKRLAFIAGEVEDGRVSPTLWYSTPPPDDIDPEADLVCINVKYTINATKSFPLVGLITRRILSSKPTLTHPKFIKVLLRSLPSFRNAERFIS